jgi:hypothetical protein
VQAEVRTDDHIWKPLAETRANILYVQPNEHNQRAFREWAESCSKIEGKDFIIDAGTFEAAFTQILSHSRLTSTFSISAPQTKRQKRRSRRQESFS